MTEEPEDRHPNDAEAERLLGLLADAMRERAAAMEVPEGETYAQRADREQRARIARAEIDRIEQALNDLSFADPDAQPITRSTKKPGPPPGPLLPGPPSWRTSVSSYHGAEAEEVERARADAIIEAAARDALIALEAKVEPPKIVAMQVYDHHVARGERLPDHALELLARAMRIDPRSVTALQRRAAILRADEARRSTKEIANELGIDPRSVRLLRNRPVPDDVALFAAVAEGKDLGALRPAVAAVLGLLGKDGYWRTDVLAAIHVGTRNPDLAREAARVEAGRRKAGKERNNAKLIARAMRIDPRWVERWIARSDWEMAVTAAGMVVTAEAVRLRKSHLLRPRKGEVIAYQRGEGLVQMADLRSDKRNPDADRD